MIIDLFTLGVRWPKGQVFKRELMGNTVMPDLPKGHYTCNRAGIDLLGKAKLNVKVLRNFLVVDWEDIEVPILSVDSDELLLFGLVSCVDLCSKTQNRQCWPLIGERPKRNHRGDPTFGFKVVIHHLEPTPQMALQFLAMIRED